MIIRQSESMSTMIDIPLMDLEMESLNEQMRSRNSERNVHRRMKVCYVSTVCTVYILV